MSSGSKGQDICDRTRKFALMIIKLYQLFVTNNVGRVIGKQLLRAGTSIGANVEEAQAGQSIADFISKMNIALKEARETRYWLKLSQEAELFPSGYLDEALSEVEEIIRILFSIIQRAKKR
jgi:four helix bundle protein